VTLLDSVRWRLSGIRQRVVRQRYALRLARPNAQGINVAGYLRAELGIGEIARRLVRAFEHGQIPHSTVTYRRTISRQHHPFTTPDEVAAPYDVNLVCVNADQFRFFRRDVGPAFFRDRYTIGLWFWEVSRFPSRFHRAFEHVDEVWVASEFVAAAIAAETSKPVRIIPVPILEPSPPLLSRRELSLPDGFLFLFTFDHLSIFERKNPIAIVEAFSRAFAPAENAALVIKTINGDKDRSGSGRLRAASERVPQVHLIDGYASSDEQNALVAACDCYVSLHRSEGYGLTMADAMAHGKPVIATAYSGNLTFMNERNSFLVPFTDAVIPEGCGPYPAGERWAEPDVAAAGSVMRRVYESAEARAVGAAARGDVLATQTLDRTASFVRQRLDEVRAERREALRADDLDLG
jgi:glycosyltransferase involved in cell wall biosynthesis